MNMGSRFLRVLGLGFALFTASFSIGNAWAFGPVPECLGQDHEQLSINNNQVIQWRESTKDQFHSRALVQGVITNVYPEKTGHAHFAINLDHVAAGDIEIIYNQEFGHLPVLQPGMTVVACGDYITAGPRSRLPSPMGAIIHWVHYNPGDRDGGVHPHGYLVINGQPYGFSAPVPRNDF